MVDLLSPCEGYISFQLKRIVPEEEDHKQLCVTDGARVPHLYFATLYGVSPLLKEVRRICFALQYLLDPVCNVEKNRLAY